MYEKLIYSLVTATFLVAGNGTAQTPGPADHFPSKPIRIIAAGSAGGGNDSLSRILGAKMTENWGQPVITEIRAGASGIVGSEFTARAAPDGYTLLVIASGYALNPYIYSRLPYDTMRDFERVSLIANAPNVLVVHPSVPLHSVKELIAFTKAKPGVVNFASSGKGTVSFLSAAMFMGMTGTRMVEVPYKGAGDSARAIISGQVHLIFTGPSAIVSFIKAGRLRALGVTAPQRIGILPEVPTIAEALPGYEVQNFFGLLAPAKTPSHIVNKLSAEVARIVKLPEVRLILEEQGFIPVGNRPEEFTTYMRAKIADWTKVLSDLGVKPE
ncbi:MAG: tripartite tricarboxylate transporter substrate binding protein [Burkholderiales bacterium]|nr:tripartite tricarboxylate transporter substrate binding protein [Burkholderiales bacterium]